MAKRKFDEIGGVVEPPPYPPVKLEFRLEERNPYDDQIVAESKSNSTSLFNNIITNGVHEESKPEPKFSTEWNERFQSYYELSSQSPEQRLDRAVKLSTLYNEFVNRAKELGKTIIEEYSLAAKFKTVDRFGDRGMAGGEKFLRDGIFFKLATDHVGIYGGDSFSMKAADHEIKSLNALLACDIPKLHLPMMVVLDYYGFRLVAEAALPVNRKTIVYGSDDGCKTLHDDDAEMRYLVKTAARRLGLKAHQVKTLQYDPVRPRWLQGPAASHPLTTQNPQVNRSYHYRKKNIPRFSSWKGHRFFGGERTGPNPMDRPPHSSDMNSSQPFGPPRKKLRISREGDAAVVVVTPTVTVQSSAMFDESKEVLISSDSNLESTYDITMEDGKVTGVITGDPYNEGNTEEIAITDNGTVIDDTSNLLATALASDNDVGGYSDVNPIEGEASNSLPSTQPLEDSTTISINNTNILPSNTNAMSLAVLSSNDFTFSSSPRSPVPMPHTPSGMHEETWTLHFPADVEGHKGTDDRLYILDVQRLFPAEDEFLQTFGVKIHCDLKIRPELVCINRSKFDEEIGSLLGEHVDWIEKQVPEETMMIYSAYDTGLDNSEHVNIIASFVTDMKTVGNAIITTGSKRESLYYLFRPELIRQSSMPISSDVYSKFGQDNHEEHEREAKQLRKKLLDEVIPSFVDWLCNNSERVISALHLPALMHKWGINLRYLGRIYSLLPAHHRMKDNLLGYQMIARVIKSQLRTKLRAQNFTSPIIDREKCVVNFFNMVLGESIRSDQYWQFSIPLQLLLKYGPFGFDLKDIDTATLKTKLSKLTLFHLLQEFTGVKFKPEVSKLFKSEQHYPQDARLIRDSSSSQVTAAEVSSVNVEAVRRSRAAPLTIADIDSIRVQLKTVKDIRGGWQQMWDNIATCCQTESATELGPDDSELEHLHHALLTHPDESRDRSDDTCQVRDEQHAGQLSLADQRTAAILNPAATSPRQVSITRVLSLARLRKRQLQLVRASFGEHTPQTAACAFLLVDLFSAHHCHEQARVYARLGIEALLNADLVPVEVILGGLFVLGVASERAAQLSVASALYCGLLNITEELFDSGVTGATPFEMELHERLERIYSAQLDDTQYAGCQSDASVPDKDCDTTALHREISVQLMKHQSKLTSLRSIFRKKLDTQKLVTKCLLFKKMCGLTYSFKQLLHEFDSHVVEFFFGANPVQLEARP